MKRILVVDDSATVRTQLTMTLESAGYSVVEAADGVAGSQAIAADVTISLVFCDVNMPRMNGIEMVERIADGPGSVPPVVMLTTEVSPALIRRARAAGAKGWMVKPFDPATVLATAERVVGGA